MTQPNGPRQKPRGRPAQSGRQIAEMRARITGCALKLFQEEGFAAVSMRRIATEAGCTVMTVYNYFERKIDILRELWAQVFEELFGALEREAAQHSDAASRLMAVSLGYVEFWLERRDHYFMVFMSSGISQSDVSVFVGNEAVLARFNIFRDSLAGALGNEASGEVLTLKSELLLCALNGIAHNLITISAYPWSKPEALVREAVSGVLKR
jgi:AcrR family transcriptional regulator